MGEAIGGVWSVAEASEAMGEGCSGERCAFIISINLSGGTLIFTPIDFGDSNNVFDSFCQVGAYI
jgi:hypothetical protein